MTAFQIPSSSEISPAVKRAIDAVRKFGDSTFLPLAGGVLTGNVSGTTLTLSGLLSGVNGTFTGTVTAATFSGSGASLTNVPAASLTGTVASARISGAYTGITGVGTLNGVTVGPSNLIFAGSNGVNWSAYGGSIWMQDSTWVRTDKNFYNGGNTIANDGSLSIRTSGTIDTSWPVWFNCNVHTNGVFRVSSAANVNGNIRFDAANPYINASSYIIMPGGLYVSGGTLYVQGGLRARSAITNDSGNLAIDGGSTGIITMSSGGFQATASTSGYQALYWGTTFANVARFTSKRATKDNIRTLTNVGDIVDALRPVTFVPKAVDEESDELRLLREADVQHGFIAEEVALVADGKLAVWEPDDVELVVPAAWRQPDMIALLVAEVKDLRKRVTDLENICGT